MNKTKYIVVTGGVISGVGKGVTTASIAKIMQEHGYTVTVIKIDPYINYDAGTLRPTEHGEVWVTDDGGEIDQDLGTYERFLNTSISRINNITTGQVYKSVIDAERRGMYLGQTVQFVPHITDEITRRIQTASAGYDIAVIEIGGTVGDYENVPFLFALKGLEREFGSQYVCFVLVSYLPSPRHIDEMKTKPTQQAIKLLCEQGIMPDFIVCRADKSIDPERIHKIEMIAHISTENIFAAPDVQSVYEIPLALERQQCGKKLLAHLALSALKEPDWHSWTTNVQAITQKENQVRVAIIGKYLNSGDFQLTDSYLSVSHALVHAAAHQNLSVDIQWIDAQEYEQDPKLLKQLDLMHGIIVPGGFGTTAVEGKIAAIAYARLHAIPFLGLCYGMQLAVIEYARNVCNMAQAHTTEVDSDTQHPIIDILPWQKHILEQGELGGTMRLGAYTAQIQEQSRVWQMYAQTDRMHNNQVSERHRHRYEVNPLYIELLEQAGLQFSGFHERKDGTRLAEFIELPTHPYFIATQAHPEFTSRFNAPNPLFSSFIAACKERELLDIVPHSMDQVQFTQI